MTNERMIEIIKRKTSIPLDGESWDEINEAYNMAIKALEERPRGEWILVSERLPDIAKKCILQLSDGYITMGTYHSIGKWTFVETGIAYAYGKETVIAWMPLPKLYKEEEG